MFATLTTKACHTNNYSNGVPMLSDLFTWLFSVLALLFFISGGVMAYFMHRYYPDFYREYSKLIYLATFCLTIPLLTRALNSYFY